MGLTATIIVLVVLALVLISGLAYAMSRPKELRPHRPAGGRPSARMRFRRRHRRDSADPGSG
jgi:hypothetical protein